MKLCEWQKYAPNGLVYPWWTHPCLDWLETQDWSNYTMLETGAGLGTAWLRSKCMWVDSIESNLVWGAKVRDYCMANSKDNGALFIKELAEGVPEFMPKYLCMIPEDKQYDIISVDGIYRTEMVEWALKHFTKEGYSGAGILIMDNENQDFVWISPKVGEMLKPYSNLLHTYYQPDHTNHEGKQWNTKVLLMNEIYDDTHLTNIITGHPDYRNG